MPAFLFPALLPSQSTNIPAALADEETIVFHGILCTRTASTLPLPLYTDAGTKVEELICWKPVVMKEDPLEHAVQLALHGL